MGMDRSASIDLLNKAVAEELQAVHQYMYFHLHLEDLGYMPLAQLFKRVAIQEMGHIELLAGRVLFLKGDVSMVAAGPTDAIMEPEAMLGKAMAMEEGSIRGYNAAATACAANADAGSKQVFERLVTDEERHFEQWERQRDNIRRFGLSYLALQSFEGSPAANAAAAD